ncbi:hypothetical protein BXZ70DRAFT_97576 [Cristinia sonorae]|uniref:Uncharacterized protein n=1 Tax=Cristinia sonorae TaxID=1940300 RepID=A0A8K0XR65_9AGAR|nr:hypothetical protein BXZ70DRAFT_97576 [Cristinia sonorae]
MRTDSTNSSPDTPRRPSFPSMDRKRIVLSTADDSRQSCSRWETTQIAFTLTPAKLPIGLETKQIVWRVYNCSTKRPLMIDCDLNWGISTAQENPNDPLVPNPALRRVLSPGCHTALTSIPRRREGLPRDLVVTNVLGYKKDITLCECRWSSAVGADR